MLELHRRATPITGTQLLGEDYGSPESWAAYDDAINGNDFDTGELAMQGTLVIRVLGHDGIYRYYNGTDNMGGVLFGPVDEARFFGPHNVEKIEVLCRGQDFDVEVVPYRDSMKVNV